MKTTRILIAVVAMMVSVAEGWAQAQPVLYTFQVQPNPVPTISSMTPTSGLPGTVVTIRGTNLDWAGPFAHFVGGPNHYVESGLPNARTRINLSPETRTGIIVGTTYVSRTEIRVVVPSGAQTGAIQFGQVGSSYDWPNYPNYQYQYRSWYNNATSGVFSVRLPAPTNLRGSAAPAAVTLSWDFPSTLSARDFELFQVVGGSWTSVRTVAAGLRSVTITGLAAGTNHQFKVRARSASAGQDSDFSNVVTVATPAAPASSATVTLLRSSATHEAGPLSGQGTIRVTAAAGYRWSDDRFAVYAEIVPTAAARTNPQQVTLRFRYNRTANRLEGLEMVGGDLEGSGGRIMASTSITSMVTIAPGNTQISGTATAVLYYAESVLPYPGAMLELHTALAEVRFDFTNLPVIAR